MELTAVLKTVLYRPTLYEILLKFSWTLITKYNRKGKKKLREKRKFIFKEPTIDTRIAKLIKISLSDFCQKEEKIQAMTDKQQEWS